MKETTNKEWWTIGIVTAAIAMIVAVLIMVLIGNGVFSGDQLYGGITFRAKISKGLKAGEVHQVMDRHYDLDSSVILAVDIGE